MDLVIQGRYTSHSRMALRALRLFFFWSFLECAGVGVEVEAVAGSAAPCARDHAEVGVGSEMEAAAGVGAGEVGNGVDVQEAVGDEQADVGADSSRQAEGGSGEWGGSKEEG